MRKDIKKVGLIGLGQQMECDLTPAVLNSKGIYDVIAICDKEPEKINIAAKSFPNAKAYLDYKELIRSEKELDFVIISLPHYLHFEVTRECIKNGVAVFKEKPLTKSISEANKIVKEAINKKIHVYTITKRNFYQSYKRAKELLSELGHIYQYTAKHFVTGGNIHEGWKSTFAESGGGVVINLAYHLLDILISFFGPVSNGNMYSSNTGNQDYKYEVDDSATALMLHENGTYGSFQFNCYTGVKQESIEINGTKGTLVVTKTDVYLYSQNGKEMLHETYKTDGVAAISEALEKFYDSNFEEVKNNLLHHQKIMQAINMLYKNSKLISKKL